MEGVDGVGDAWSMFDGILEAEVGDRVGALVGVPDRGVEVCRFC